LNFSAETDAFSIYETDRRNIPGNRIDKIVTNQLTQKGMSPANLCSDVVFIRRIYLDMTGRLPEIPVVRQFLRSSDKNKRRDLIEALFLSEKFTIYWTYKWCDLLRVKAEYPIKLWPNAAHAYYQWIYKALNTNMPYDQFALELLTSSGSNFRTPQVNFYRAVQNNTPSAISQVVALTFMGSRIKYWDQKTREGFESFFSQIQYKGTAEWKEEIVTWDFLRESPVSACFPDGHVVDIPSDTDPRVVLSKWLISKDNPWFASNISNRIWYWLMGRGIIEEPDDIREGNPPSNPRLLSYLENELIAADYDMRHLFRLILNSRTYQQSSIHNSGYEETQKLFAVYPVRRLEAEVLIDALCDVTGHKESYFSQIPEPFTFIPKETGAIGIADGSISSPFLDLYGRSPRDTGLMSERSNQPSQSQRLHLLNSSHIQKKMTKGNKVRKLIKTSEQNPQKWVTMAYLTILSRYPTQKEVSVIKLHALTGGLDTKEKTHDLVWALINSKEFLYRH